MSSILCNLFPLCMISLTFIPGMDNPRSTILSNGNNLRDSLCNAVAVVMMRKGDPVEATQRLPVPGAHSFQVLTSASMKRTVFWDIATCSLVELDRCF